MKFFTADLHLFHRKVPLYEPGRAMYRSIDEMNETIIYNINSRCTKRDELWILGDMSLGKTKDVLELIQFIEPTIHLISGNHDPTWTYKKRHARMIERYLEAGIASIADETTTEVQGVGVVLSHFPYKGSPDGDHTQEDRYVSARPDNHGSWLLCGHVHSLWLQRGKQINVGIDANPKGHFPHSETEIHEMIQKGPQDID